MASMGFEKTGKRWRVFWHVSLPDRTVDKGSQSFKDKKKAKQFKEHCEKREQLLKQAIFVAPNYLSDAVEEWKLFCQGYTDRTAKFYVYEVNRFLAALPQEVVYITDLQTLHINTYLNARLSSGVKNRTVNNAMASIKALCRYLTENYKIENPAKGIKKLREDPPSPHFLTHEEYESVLSKVEPFCKPWVMFLANTGLRASEFCNLTWKYCDLNQKTVTVIGKGRKKRTLSLNQTAYQILCHQREIRPSGPDTVVFTRKDGTDLSRFCLSESILKACRNAGLSGGGPHAFRHFFATQLLLRGIPIIKVSMLLGHTSISTTQRHYSHILSSDLSGVTDILDSA